MHPYSEPSPWSPGPQVQTVTAEARPSLLVAVNETDAPKYAIPSFNRSTVHTTTAALQSITRERPSVVIIDLDVAALNGPEICRMCAALPLTSVLVTTVNTATVPAALKAGCHAVLLKPFAPNLLFGRLGRLLRARSTELRYRAMRQHAKAQHLRDRSDLLLAGTNQHWPNSHCPHCDHHGVTSFEYASYRRAWYACLACKKVWLAKRQE